MISKVQQGLSLGSCTTFPSPNLHFELTFGSLTLCQVLSSGKQRQIKPRRYIGFEKNFFFLVNLLNLLNPFYFFIKDLHVAFGQKLKFFKAWLNLLSFAFFFYVSMIKLSSFLFSFFFFSSRYKHNFKRITRILKALRSFGYKELMYHWLRFLAQLIYRDGKLIVASHSFKNYWVKTLGRKYRKKLLRYSKELSSKKFPWWHFFFLIYFLIVWKRFVRLCLLKFCSFFFFFCFFLFSEKKIF